MKMRNVMKSNSSLLLWLMLVLIAICFGSCKDKDDGDSTASGSFDPAKPVVISHFLPKTGGLGSRLILYGDNFGTDISKIKVTIGGKDARVIGSNGSSIYCIVPNQAYEGTIEVAIVNDSGEKLVDTVASEKFTYEKKMLVTTFLGTMTETGGYIVKDGPFDDCGGLGGTVWLTFDPKNNEHMYLVGEQHPFRLVDFGKQWLSTVFNSSYSGMSKMRTIAWTKDGDHMLISNDQTSETGISVVMLSREGNFKDVNVLVRSRNCNGIAVHPINGELYYNSYDAGQVLRYDFETGQKETLFPINDRNYEFFIQIHPSGNYAYIVVENQHYIVRSNYDWDSKTFMPPFIVCGQRGSAGWNDAVGQKAKLNKPMQGTFVKNPAYAGKEDEYDFYFSDRENHCIRILTPDGKVSTFAGRGSPSVNNKVEGYIDGDLRKEARFNHPEGLIYDEENKCFYVGDRENRRIRKIAYEE